jgi:hypothetical protein
MTRVGIFILVISTLFPPRAYAVTGKDSWDTIRKTSGLIIVQPEFAKAFGTKGLFNACATDEQFRNIDPVRSCPDDKSDCCLEYTLQQVAVERLFSRNICTERQYQKCMSYETIVQTHPKSFYLPVLEKKPDGSRALVFSKKYSVPECE